MALSIDHPSVKRTWHEVSLSAKTKAEYTKTPPHVPPGRIILVVETNLATDPGHSGFDSSELDDLIDKVDEAIAGHPLYAGARIVSSRNT